MEYMEIPTFPKVVLDNLLASMSNPASFKEPAPPIRHNNGYRPMPAPLFHGTTIRPPAPSVPPKPPGASLPPLPGGGHRREVSASPFDTKDCPEPLGTGGSMGAGGSTGPPALVKEKPKRVRKSRAGATPKKRGVSDSVFDANLDSAQQPPQLPPPKRRRPSNKSLGDGENAENTEKPPPRKRNRSKGKSKDEYALSVSTTDTSLSHLDPTSTKGISGAYGLETKAPDLTRYMKDISLESLMAGDFNVPSFPHKQGPPPGSMGDNSFGLHVSSILQNLTRSSNTEQVRLAPYFSKKTESKPQKFSLDLESMPLDESEQSLGGGLLDTKIKAPCYDPSLLQSRKTQEALSRFSLETIPVIPPADFWNTLQIQPNVSLNSLIAQASATSDSRFPPSEMGSSCDKASTLPPPIFSLGSLQVLQESTCDRLANSRLNHWFRAESPKRESSEALPGHVVSTSLGSVFPFKLDAESDAPTRPTEKRALKEGLFDFDLNEQSPEAEAAESIAHSASTKPLSANEQPVVVQAMIDTDGSNERLQSIAHVNVSDHAKEVEAICNIQSATDVQNVGDISNKCASSPQKNETRGRQMEDSSFIFVNRNHSFGEFKDMSTNASSSLPTLLVPDGPETEEMYSEMPYSPGMQATARLLCRMACSSSPFYVEQEDERLQVPAPCNDASIEQPTKAAKVVGSVEKDVLAHKYPAWHESRDEEHASKVQVRDGKEKSVYSQIVSSCTHVDKAEPWASTPPRHAPKIVASRMSGSQSSESDRSPCHGPREHVPNGNHRNTKRLQRDREGGEAGALRKVSSSFPRKDSKGNHTPVSKTSLLRALPTKGGTSVSAGQKRSLVACETKHAEGLTKLSRPRSNISKSCLQSHSSSTNGFPVQPRNLSGCAIKSPGSRHVLPYVGEVRHGLK